MTSNFDEINVDNRDDLGVRQPAYMTIEQPILWLLHEVNGLGIIPHYVTQIQTALIEGQINRARIERHLNHIVKTVRDIQQYGQVIFERSFAFDLSNTDLMDCITAAVNDVTPAIHEKGLQFLLESEFQELSLHCDPFWITVAVRNVLENAVKFTPNGTIAVRCGRYQSWVYIEIEDTGVGIPEEIIGRIFEDRFQASRKSDGMGMGLPIVKSVVERHGGTVTVESEIDKGSSFRLELPTASSTLMS
ncbi:MAG: HAMP domain-containing histidine kinase [Caldilineaceae bacterium]|nr:HAMP domain-containing histidine kinase [Caldilineaceae bacterium]